MILGVMLIGWVLFWAAKRVMKPPIMMMLIPTKNPVPDSKKTTTLKTPAQSINPAKSKKQSASKSLLRIILIFLILGVTVFACSSYINGPTPGLIEGGMALDLSGRGLISVPLGSDVFLIGLSSKGLTIISPKDVPQDNLVIVDLSRNPLTELPPDIGQFSNIQALFIKDTQLTTLPPEIGQLTNLDTLSLRNNQLIELPPEIGQLTELEYLDLEGYQLTTLPPEIGQLKNLRELNLYRNPIGKIPSEIKQQLPNLGK